MANSKRCSKIDFWDSKIEKVRYNLMKSQQWNEILEMEKKKFSD